MANLDRITNIQIGLNTSLFQPASFDQLMVLITGAWSFRVGTVTGADQLLIAPYSLSSSSPGYLAVQACFSQEIRPAYVYIGRVDAGDASPAVTMAAIVAENNGFYVFGEAARTTAKALGFAAWAEANNKIFVVGVTGDDGVQGTLTDVAGTLKTGNYYRSFAMHYAVNTDFPEFALMAKQLQTLPGGETYANVTLAGVTAANITEAQYQNIIFRNSNSYESFTNGAQSLNLTQNGKTSGGEWFDIIRFRDWLREDMKVEVANLFPNRKIPFTDPGIRLVKGAMIKSLARGQRRGGIALDTPNATGTGTVPGFTVTVPLAADISASQKASRRLIDCSFRATLQGAIHATTITGNLTYDVA